MTLSDRGTHCGVCVGVGQGKQSLLPSTRGLLWNARACLEIATQEPSPRHTITGPSVTRMSS